MKQSNVMLVRSSCVCAVLASVAGTAVQALAQPATLIVESATGLARAVSGDGTGANQQASSDISGYNLSASKSFSTGSSSASTSWGGISANWILSGSFGGTAFANSANEAGSSETSNVIVLDADEDFDVEYSGGYSVTGNFGSAIIELRNIATNGAVVGGQGVGQGHMPAGRYRLTVTSYASYSSVTGGYELQFRPGNDRCQFARVIGNGTHTGSTTFATASGDGVSSCGTSNTTKSVWYKYTPTRSGTLKLDTCGSSYDTVLTVYQTASCPSGSGSEVGCSDDDLVGGPCAAAGNRTSYLSLAVTAGLPYYIRVSGFNGASGNYVLHVGPGNDDCSEAQPVSIGSYPFDNTLATTDGPVLNTCSNGGADTQVNGDLWYSFVAPASGTLTVDTCGSTFDTKMAMYANLPCSGRSTYLACSDDNCGVRQSKIVQPVIVGHTYAIRVGGYLANRGPGTLNLAFLACPADFNNDGFVDGFDYDDFVACFEGDGCPPGQDADFNNDGFPDGFDYDEFVAAFEAGCL